MNATDAMEIIMQQIKQPLWENWFIKEKIGSGAFGAVYRTESVRSSRVDVSALKIQAVVDNGQLFADESQKVAFLEKRKKSIENESTIMYRLRDCPNIVRYEEDIMKPLYYNSRFEGYYFLIRMEYLSNVYEMIRTRRFDFSEKNVLRLTKDICNGLKAAHEMDIIHRDIKPANLFVSGKGVYKLGDFGISKQAVSTRSFAGSPEYMAPEVFRAKSDIYSSYTKQADIYSLGICLYQLMNNCLLPFESPACSNEEAFELRMQNRPLPLPANASPEFAKIILRACAFNTAERYRNVEELLNDIALLESGAPIASVSVDPYASTIGLNSTAYAGGSTSYAGGSTSYAGNSQYMEQSQYIQPQPYPTITTPPEQYDKNSSAITAVLVIVILLFLFVIGFLFFNFSGMFHDDSDDKPESKSSSSAVHEEITTEEITEEETAEETTTTEAQTTTTTTTTTIIVTAQPLDYEILDTTLIVRADEVDQLPLRSTPAKVDNILTRIPDGTQVHALGYRELETEVWFKVEYNGYQGFVRGGMVQPNNLDMLNDPIFDVPALNKWKNKFYLQSPNTYYSSSFTRYFKGTLYFIPDLSSGVQRRFKERTGVSVTAVDSTGDWYFVEFTYGSQFYNGWVHNSQLSR